MASRTDESVARLRALHHQKMPPRMRTRESARDVYRVLSDADGALSKRDVQLEAHVSDSSAEHWLRRFRELGIVTMRPSVSDRRIPVYEIRDPWADALEEVEW